MQTTFQGDQIGWFPPNSENWKWSVDWNENFYGVEDGKLWIHSSIAILEAHKSESGVETNCC